MRWAALVVVALAGCTAPSQEIRVIDAGCISYAGARRSMPRPVPDTELGRWINAELDAKMTRTCKVG